MGFSVFAFLTAVHTPVMHTIFLVEIYS